MPPADPQKNLAQDPTIRRLEQKLMKLEKEVHDVLRRNEELVEGLKTMEAKYNRLVRALARTQPGLPTALNETGYFSAERRTGAPERPSPSVASATMVAMDRRAASPTPVVEVHAAAEPLSTAKIDALLSNLGIRLVETHGNLFELESMNAWGAEQLKTLGTSVPREQIEAFVRAKADLA